MSDTRQAIRVEALKPHTYNGQSYEVGDQYDFYPSTDPGGISVDDQVTSLQTTGFATRVDRAKVAKAQAAAAKASIKAQAQAAKAKAAAPKKIARPKAKAKAKAIRRK